MSSSTAAGRSILRSRGLAALVLVVLAMAAVGLFVTIPSGESLNQTLIRDLSGARIGGGRFFRASAIDFDKARYRKTLADAELSLLSMPDSPLKQRIQALVDAGNGKFQDAARTLQTLSQSDPRDVELLNDLGVVYLALGEQNAVNYFRALTLFDRAKELSPRAAAPRFNTVIAFRLAGLRERSATGMGEYKQLEISSFWGRELSTEPPTDAQMVAALRESLSRADVANARELIARSPESYRVLAMDYALAPSDVQPFDETFSFILNTLRDSTDDRTIDAILAPLDTVNHQKIIHARMLVHEGIKAYQLSRFADSVRFYDLAEETVKGSGSPFDALWIELNRTDIDIRVSNIASARPKIEHVIAKAREANFQWLLGQALTSQASNVRLLRNYDDSVRILYDAVNIFSSIGTPRHAVRTMSYLATAHAIAGDSETSLQLTRRTLCMTRSDDHVRLSSLYVLYGAQLYRMGFEQYAIQLEELAVTEARATQNPAILSNVLASLAMIHATNHNYTAAQQDLTETNATLKRVESPEVKAVLALQSNILCARIKIDTGNLAAAEECLSNNLDILNRQPIKFPIYSAQTLLQLSEVHALQGQVESARRKLREAVEIVEENDTYLAGDSLRVSFENERRSLYDIAIAFEYDHDGKETAWRYVQRYRSKLFLEFLRQMNPGVDRIHSTAINRDKVQQLIPQNVQVVEYVMLKDRLLIWVVSRDTFNSVVIPVTRAELEKTVSGFLTATQGKAELRQLAGKLHRLLIDPIEDQLDPRRTLAIIPDQALHRLNFSALVSAGSKTYLVERYTLLESPSLTSLLSAGGASPRRTGVVAFGAQTDDTDATLELRGLKPLYGDIRTYNGATAVKTAFLSSFVNASIFHYAGHSQDASDPLRSSILLDGNKEGPNSVSAVDIAARHMPVNSVVVLASCDSSVGNSRDGLGVRGLTSAFLISGAGSVVGSLWLVEAESTSHLVLAFHKGFAQEHLPVAESLRKAQLQFIARGIHPYYWSGFVVTGNLSALR